MITAINETCVEVSNSLLRGELAAIETYRKALERYPDTVATPELMRIQSEHRLSANSLSEYIREMGGTPDTISGAWGSLAKAIQTSANVFGAESAIEFLIVGEKHGRNDYRKALDYEDVLDPCKAIIRNELLPRVKRNISTLRRLGE